MIVCVECKKEMTCTKTGIGVNFGNGHVYAGDKYGCKCGREIISTNPQAGYDPEYRYKTEYLDMSENAEQDRLLGGKTRSIKIWDIMSEE